MTNISYFQHLSCEYLLLFAFSHSKSLGSEVLVAQKALPLAERNCEVFSSFCDIS